MRRNWFPALIVAEAVLRAAALQAAGDRFVSFAADVTVREDTTLEVREEFLVHSEGTYFKWGMVRMLPIGGEARWDRRFVGGSKGDNGIGVKILEVSEDGARVSHEQGSGGSYEQLRIGPADVPLARGDHRFVIRYEVEGALRLAADHDEFYWNALGHYWQLPVDDARIRVRLPAGVLRAEGYAGGRGVSNPRRPETELTREDLPDGVGYRVTNLGPAQSVSVAVSWPKGFVTRPTMGAFARDRGWLAAPILLALYYLIAWLAVGREPARGSVVTRYEPPEGLSPAAVRYVRTTGSDGRTLAAVIAQLAARGCLKVEPQDARYRLTALQAVGSGANAMAPEEARVLAMLFRDGPATLTGPGEGDQLSPYVEAIQDELRKRLDGVYFTRNFRYIAPAALASFGAAMGMALTAQGRDTTGVVFLTWWFLFCGTLLGTLMLIVLIPAWARVLRGLGSARQLLVGTVFMGGFSVVLVLLLVTLARNVSPTFSLVLGALLVINLAWAPALKRLTARGRQAVDEIEGFRAFLERVEEDRMQRLNAPAEAPRAATEFLPYAIALEVREAWGDHLAEAFFATMTQR